jgi:hypothetical protein
MPFLITGVFRLLDDIPLSGPFIFFGLIGLVFVFIARMRPIGIGVIIGTLFHATLLVYIFMTMGSIGP